ncbi:hypothetical protein MMC07_009479 [Pseudocyphellaria aurata]|nr:hypothetical protein [Pseudocyphellaria aurata]
MSSPPPRKRVKLKSLSTPPARIPPARIPPARSCSSRPAVKTRSAFQIRRSLPPVAERLSNPVQPLVFPPDDSQATTDESDSQATTDESHPPVQAQPPPVRPESLPFQPQFSLPAGWQSVEFHVLQQEVADLREAIRTLADKILESNRKVDLVLQCVLFSIHADMGSRRPHDSAG